MTAGWFQVQVRGLSDIGNVREENQDALLMHEPEEPEVLASKGIFVALADGMGGLEGGSMASRLAVEAAQKHYYEDPAEPRESLERAVQEANRAIFRHSVDREGGRQMGSTLTAVALVGGRAYIAQVGDSRAYRFGRGALRQVTKDHSLVRELLDRGEIDESSARYNFHRNILTRGLGLREEVTADVYELGDFEEGDTLLLSSDGLHALVQEDEMASCLEKYGPRLQEACRELIRVARDRGGPDNITVALVRVESVAGHGAPAAGQGSGAHRAEGPRVGWALPILVFLSFAAGVVLTLLVQDDAARWRRVGGDLREELRAAQGAADRIAAGGTADPGVRDPGAVQDLQARLDRMRRLLEGSAGKEGGAGGEGEKGTPGETP